MILLMFFISNKAIGQTYYSMATGNYSETFTGWVGYSTNWNGQPVMTTGTIPSATKTTVVSNGTTMNFVGSGSTIGYDAATSTKLVFLTTGTTDNNAAIACDLNLNFSGRLAGNLSFDANTIFNSTGNRNATLRVYYTFDGSAWTELTGTNLPYVATNNVVGSGAISMQLPSVLDNKSTVTFRFYCHNGTGGTTGSRPKIGIDNVIVTSTASIAAPTKLAITSISPTTPIAGSGFSVTVQSQDASGTATNVSAATSFDITSNGNAGTIGGTLTGTIAAGTNSVTVTGVILPNAGTGVVLTSTVNTGDTLTAATSSAFNVIATSNAPTITSVTPGNTQLSVAFTAPTSDGGSAISNYKYSTNGTTFVACSPAQTTSPILITGLTNGLSYPIQILAVNAAGDGLVSNTVSGIPAAPAIPTISASVSTLSSALSTFYGTASSALSFTVSGSALTNDITLTAPAGFEISISSASTGFTGAAGSIVLVHNSGVVPTTTVYVRLIGADTVGNYSGTISIVSSGATSLTVATISSTVSPKELTITGLSGVDKEYDTLFGATVSGTPVLNGIVSGDESFVALTSTSVAANFLDGLVATNKPITLSGYGLSGTKSTNYSLTLPSLSANITAKPITISNAQAIDKPYDGNLAAVITGQLTGVILPDVVTLVGTGTFATSAVAAGIIVTSTATITGTAATNYTLTQPTNLSASITSANQTITFSALATKAVGESLSLNAFSATSTLNPISFTSSNITVATISGNVVTILTPGTTTITASQAGSANYAAAEVFQTLNVVNAIAKWTFETADFSGTAQTPVVSVGSALAEYGGLTTGSEVSGYHASASTVWSTPTGNASANSLSANNWGVGDYFQFKLATENFYNLSVSYDQTSSSTGPRDFKFQYSIDGTTFTDFGTEYMVNANSAPNSWSSSNYYSLFNNTNNLNTLTELNNKPFVYFRIVNTSTTAVNAGTTANTGTDRVDNFTVIGSPCPSVTPTFSAAPFASTCISDNTTYTTETGQFNYVWTLPGVLGTDYTIASGGVGATDNSVTIHWLTSGVKAVTVSYSNSDGCTSASTSNTTTIFEVPTFTVTNPAAVCSPATANIVSSVSNTALSYQYYTNQSATTVYATPTAATAGTYFIIGGNGGCYTAPQPVTVTVNPLPTFTVTNPAAVCSPATANIVSSVSNTALTYQYYTNSNATTVYTTPTAATAGTYYIIGGNGTCYTAPQPVTVTVNALPTFTVSNPAAVCSPATVNITTAVSNSALSYQYYTNSNATTVYTTPTAANAGTYYIIGGNGTCYTAPQPVTVTVNALPTFTVTNPAAVCSPATVNITTAVSNTALTYQYYTNQSATTVYATPTAATAGTYYIIGGNGTCYSATESVIVTVNALPTVAAITGITTLATFATTTLASASTGGVWSSSDEAVATVNPNGVVTGISMGAATITYTVTIGGCSNSQSVLVGVSALGTTDFDSASLSFYPNPTNDNLYLNYKEAISGVEMYNLLGQKVLEVHPNVTFATLNVSNLSGGTYFVKISSSDFFTTIKVVKR